MRIEASNLTEAFQAGLIPLETEYISSPVE